MRAPLGVELTCTRLVETQPPRTSSRMPDAPRRAAATVERGPVKLESIAAPLRLNPARRRSGPSTSTGSLPVGGDDADRAADAGGVQPDLPILRVAAFEGAHAGTPLQRRLHPGQGAL